MSLGCEGAGLELRFAAPTLCTDNAAMIAFAAQLRLGTRRDDSPDDRDRSQSRLALGFVAERSRCLGVSYREVNLAAREAAPSSRRSCSNLVLPSSIRVEARGVWQARDVRGFFSRSKLNIRAPADNWRARAASRPFCPTAATASCACRVSRPASASRFFEAQHGRISRLLRRSIFPGAFAQFLARLGDIENVVDHLEGEPERPCRNSLIALKLRRRRIGAHRTEPDGRGEQCRRLVLVDVTELRAIDSFAFAFEICDLAGDQLAAAGGDRDFAKNRSQIVARPRLRRGRDFERDREQRVARQDRDAVAEDLVTGRRGPAGNRRCPCSGDRRE